VRSEWITSERGLHDLRGDWNALDDAAHVFRSWEWQATWWRTLGRHGARDGRALRVLCVRAADGRALCILPLYTEPAPVAGRRARLLGDGVVGSDYLGAIGDARALEGRLALDDADTMELTDLDVDLRHACTGWQAVTLAPRYVCPFARVDDFQAYVDARPGGFGRQIAQRARRLARLPGFRLEIHDDPDERTLDTLFALHRERWAAEGGSQGITSPRVELFHRRAIALCAGRGWVRVGLLFVDNQPVAAGYAFVRGGRFSWYQSGLRMDPALRRHSAGMVLMVEMMRRAADHGATDFDFLHGEEPYKGIWATSRRTTHMLRARRATIAGHAQDLYRALRRAARAILR
jgi:CelD/BcsL family acetyltransferase involved in cellulose biosynthesis